MDEAEDVLQAAIAQTKDAWLRQIMLCLGGETSPDQLVSSADPDNAEQMCEAYYYAGEACLLSDQLPEARGWFEKCVGTGVEYDVDSFPLSPMNEYELAEWRLQTLPGGNP